MFYIPNINIKDWNIPIKCNIPILFSIHRGKYINSVEFKNLKNIFENFNYCLYTSTHTLKYKLTKWISLHFLFYNRVSVNYYWNVMFVNFINKQVISFSKRNFRLKIFFFLNKK